MTHLKLLAIDPAMSNFGFARLLVPREPGTFVVVEMIDLAKTKSEAGKTVRKSSDDLRRAVDLWEAMQTHAEWADLIAAEIPSGTQSARGAMGNGMSLGLLAAISTFRPLIEVSAAEAKKVATGRKTASKDEMIQWAAMCYPEAAWLRKKFKGEMRLLGSNEHMADAIAIGLAATKTPAFRTAFAVRNLESIKV